MTANETVREVCAEMLEPSSTCKACDFVQCPMLAKFAEEVKEAHEREMAAKDAQIKNLMEINDQVRDNLLEAMKSVSAKDAEIARLKATLMTICTADKIAERLREIAIDACNGMEVK